MFSNTLTGEYQKGTLINIITKGMSRWKIIVSKGIIPPTAKRTNELKRKIVDIRSSKEISHIPIK